MHRRQIRLLSAAAISIVALLAAGCGGESSSDARTLNWFVAIQPGGGLQEIANRCEEQANGDYEIEFELLPTQADQQREQLVRRLGAEDDTIDLIGMDVVWTGEFANAGWIREYTGDTKAALTEGVFESVLQTGEFDGGLYAAPIWSNTQLLWYRKDRVDQPPETWDEMIDQAEEIGADGTIQVQANRYEGVVVWTNAMIESAGTQIVSGPTEVALEQAPTERALSIMGRLSNSPAAAPDITTSTEDTARLGFEAGDSSFMINYPFVFPSANDNAPDVAKQMGAAKYPKVDADRDSRPPLGGINIGISSYSQKAELAEEAVKCLTSDENQITIAEKEGLPPVRSDLFARPEIQKIYPGFADVIRDSIETAGPRPSEAPAYQDLSLAIQRSVHPTTKIDPQDPGQTYEELKDRVEDAVNREGLL